MQTSMPRPDFQDRSKAAAARRLSTSLIHGPFKRPGDSVYAVTEKPSVHNALAELRGKGGPEVIAFGSVPEFLRFFRTDDSACLILDLPRSDGEDLELLYELAASACPPVIFICGHSDIGSAVRAMKAGAIELLTMPVALANLSEAIMAAFAQDRKLRRRRAELAELGDRYAFLTPREREVFPLIIGGLLNKQAACLLGISEVTLQIHRSQVMRKMQAGSLAELVRMAAKLRVPYWCGKQAEKTAQRELRVMGIRDSHSTHGTLGSPCLS